MVLFLHPEVFCLHGEKALYFFIYIHVQLGEAFSILCNTFTHKWHFSTFMDGCMWIIVLFFYFVPFVKWMWVLLIS